MSVILIRNKNSNLQLNVNWVIEYLNMRTQFAFLEKSSLSYSLDKFTGIPMSGIVKLHLKSFSVSHYHEMHLNLDENV